MSQRTKQFDVIMNMILLLLHWDEPPGSHTEPKW